MTYGSIWEAADAGDCEAIMDFVKNKGVEVNAGADLSIFKTIWYGVRASFGLTPLHFAAKKGHSKAIETLLSLKAHVDTQGQCKTTPMHLAAEGGHIKVVELLIQAGGEVNAQDSQQMTPLYFAADRGHIEVVKALLKAEAEVNARNHTEQTPLHIASCRGHIEVVKALLSHGAEVNSREGNFASFHRVKDLLSHGAEVDSRKDTSNNHYRERTPLHYAASGGHIEAVQALLEAKAEVNAQDYCSKMTPLHLAAQRRAVEVVKALLSHGADVNAQSRYGPPLYLAAKYNKHAHLLVETLIPLFEYGAQYPSRDRFLPKEFGQYVRIFAKNGLPPKRFGEGWGDTTKRMAILNGGVRSEEDLDKLAETLKQQQEIPQFRF